MPTTPDGELPCQTPSCQDLDKLTTAVDSWWFYAIIIVYIILLVVGWIYFAKLNKVQSTHGEKWNMSLAFAVLGTVLFPLFNIGPPIIWFTL